MPLRRRSVALALGASLSACFPGTAILPPQAPIRGELVPQETSISIPTNNGPLRVVFASPRDTAPGAAEISVVFNQPLRTVGSENTEPAPSITITPNTPGKTTWIGTSALRFVLEKPWAKATSYRVEVPKTIRSAGGKTLDEPFVFSFSTARPELSGSDPEPNTHAVRPDATIGLFFNQPVLAQEILSAVHISGTQKIPFEVAEIERERVVLKPRAPLPRNSEITVRVDPSLRGAEGDLTMGKATEIRFRTLGPFAISSVQCTPHPTDQGACDPNEGTVKMILTTPLPYEDLEQAIFVEPTTNSFSVYDASENEQGPGEIRIDADFMPGKTYSIGVRSSIAGRPLRDVHEQLVGTQPARKIRFGDLPAEVIFGASGVYWTPGKHILPIGVLNAENAVVSVIPLGRNEVLERLLTPTKPLLASASAKTQSIAGEKRNEANWYRVDVDSLLPPGRAKGPVLARASFRATPTSEPMVIEREMQLTDLGLVTKTSPFEVLAWNARLSDGAPLPGARAELYALSSRGPAKLLDAAKADAFGLVSLSANMGEPRAERVALVIEQGDDWAYQTLNIPALPEPVGVVFTSRGIYRPGERVEIKGLARYPIASGLSTPKDVDVLVRATDAQDRQIAAFPRKLSRFGTFAVEVPIADDAPLGLYRVHADLPRGSLRTRFSVDHYRPIKTKALATFDKLAYQQDERATCTVRGEYLHGAPMAAASAKIVMTRGAALFGVPNLDDFQIGQHDLSPPTTRIAQVAGQLDAKGALSVPISTTLPGQIVTETIICTAEVMDLDRQVQTTETSAIVHPAEVYVALQNPPEMWVRPGTTIEPRALVVTPSGERRVARVRLEMLAQVRREDRSYEDRSIAACDVTTGQTPVGCSFQVPNKNPREDAEIIVRATTTDAKGRSVISSYAHRIEIVSTPATNAPIPVPTPPPPPPPAEVEWPPPMLKIEMDSKLQVGKTARMTLSSPFKKLAKALVTFERESILYRQVVDLMPAGTKTTLDVPVRAAMMPNVQATVTAISGTEMQREQIGVAVDALSRELQVNVRPEKLVTTPGDTVEIEVEVTDSTGKPMRDTEVTLWAADEGSLMVTYYRTPEPWYALFSARDRLVNTADTRDELLTTWMGRHRVRPPQVRMGATSVGPRRGDFRQTLAFFADLVTENNGKVKKKIKLPDGLTAYRFMAVAVTEDERTGSGDNMVKTFKPFMVKPSLPRVIRAGDQFEASVALSTLSLPAGKATIKAAAKGLTSKGPAERVVDVTPDTPALVSFSFQADRLGKTTFSFDGSFSSSPNSSPENDGVDLVAQVISPVPLERTLVSGETTSVIADRIARWSGIRPDAGGLSISLSSSPLTGMISGIEQLVEYPYGCTEQTVSRLVPLLALRDLADSFQVPLMVDARHGMRKSVPEAIQQGVDAVLAHQQKEGGIRFVGGFFRT